MLLCWNVVRLGALQNNFWLPWKNHMISKLSCMLKLRLAIFLPCHLKSICSYGETRLGVIDICIGETNSFRMHSHWLHSYWSNLGPYANNKVVDQQFIVSTCSRDWFTSWPMPILLEKTHSQQVSFGSNYWLLIFMAPVMCHLALCPRRWSSALIFLDADVNCWLDTWNQLDLRGVPSSASHAVFTSLRVSLPYFRCTFTLPWACLLVSWRIRETKVSMVFWSNTCYMGTDVGYKTWKIRVSASPHRVTAQSGHHMCPIRCNIGRLPARIPDPLQPFLDGVVWKWILYGNRFT